MPYLYGFSVSPRLLVWVLVSTFFIYIFCHYGWSVLWLLQTGFYSLVNAGGLPRLWKEKDRT